MGPLTPTPRRYRRRGWCSRIPSTRGCHRRSEPHPRPTTDARDGTHTRGGDRTPGPHPAPETGGSGWNSPVPRTPCGHVTRTPAPHPAAHGRDAGRDPWAHTRGCDRSPVTTPRPPQVIGWDHRDSRGQGTGRRTQPRGPWHRRRSARAGPPPGRTGRRKPTPRPRAETPDGAPGSGRPGPAATSSQAPPGLTRARDSPSRRSAPCSPWHRSLDKCALRIHNTWANSGQVSTAPGGRRTRPTRAGSRPPGPIGSFRRMSLSPRYAPPRSHWALLQALRLHWTVTQSPPCGPDWTWLRDSAP